MSKKVTSIKLDLEPVYTIETKLGIKEGGPLHKYFTNTCEKHMNKYVPATPDENLASSAIVLTDMIYYPGPYAHYMYEGRVMGPNIPIKDKNGNIVRWFSRKPKYYTGADIEYKTGTHPLATSHWAEKMWTAEREDIEKELEDYVRKGCKE